MREQRAIPKKKKREESALKLILFLGLGYTRRNCSVVIVRCKRVVAP